MSRANSNALHAAPAAAGAGNGFPVEPLVSVQGLHALLRALGSPCCAQNSLFRVPQDARDLVLENLEDRILANAKLPKNLEAWARAVERNLHRSGPERRELHRDHLPHLALESFVTSVPPDPELHRSRLDTEWLEEFWARLESHLSEEEKIVLRAALAGGRSRDVVRRCGMTRRDVRCRLRRIAEKGKKLAACCFPVSAASPLCRSSHQ